MHIGQKILNDIIIVADNEKRLAVEAVVVCRYIVIQCNLRQLYVHRDSKANAVQVRVVIFVCRR